MAGVELYLIRQQQPLRQYSAVLWSSQSNS